MRKSEIWVSAVLYIVLGLVILTLLLSVGIPLINKIRDRNVVVQTKAVMFAIDSNVREIVINEGPGAIRDLSVIEIKQGFMDIDEDADRIKWSMATKNRMIEPGMSFKEGTLDRFLQETNVEGEYIINLELNYAGFADLVLESDILGPYKGTHRMFIKHTGEYTDIDGDSVPDVPKISIEIR